MQACEAAADYLRYSRGLSPASICAPDTSGHQRLRSRSVLRRGRPAERIGIAIGALLAAARAAVRARAHLPLLLLHGLRHALRAFAHRLERTALRVDGAVGIALAELACGVAQLRSPPGRRCTGTEAGRANPATRPAGASGIHSDSRARAARTDRQAPTGAPAPRPARCDDTRTRAAPGSQTPRAPACLPRR